MKPLLSLMLVAALTGSVGVRLSAESAMAGQAQSGATIVEAAQAKDAAAVRKLIKEGADVNAAQATA